MPTVLSLRNSSEGYAVRSSSYVIVLMLLLPVCLSKISVFFFLDTSSALALHRTSSLLVKHVRGG